MTDIIAVFFLIGLAALFTILLFVFRNGICGVASALAWGLLSFYNFTQYYSGDPDAGQMVYYFGWFCLALSLILFASPFWWLKRDNPMNVASEDSREKWEIDEERMEKRLNKVRRHRPKLRSFYKKP